MMAVRGALFIKFIKNEGAVQTDTAAAVVHWTWLTMNNCFPLYLSYIYPQGLYAVVRLVNLARSEDHDNGSGFFNME